MKTPESLARIEQKRKTPRHNVTMSKKGLDNAEAFLSSPQEHILSVISDVQWHLSASRTYRDPRTKCYMLRYAQSKLNELATYVSQMEAQ